MGYRVGDRVVFEPHFHTPTKWWGREGLVTMVGSLLQSFPEGSYLVQIAGTETVVGVSFETQLRPYKNGLDRVLEDL